MNRQKLLLFISIIAYSYGISSGMMSSKHEHKYEMNRSPSDGYSVRRESLRDDEELPRIRASKVKKLIKQNPAPKRLRSRHSLCRKIASWCRKDKELLQYYFFEALIEGQLGRVKELITQGVDCGAEDDEHVTPLEYAIKSKNYMLTKVLLEAGADPTIHDSQNESLVHLVFDTMIDDEEKMIRMLSLLIEAGTSVNTQSRYLKDTLLHKALRNHLSDVVAFLLKEANAGVTVANNKQITVLHEAVKTNNLDFVRMMLDKKPAMDVVDADGFKLLEHAVYQKNSKLIQMLREQGASDVPGRDGLTLLQKAIDSDDAAVVAGLIDRERAIEITYAGGESLLHRAVKRNSKQVVQLLITTLGAGSDNLDYPDDDEATPLYWALHSEFECEQNSTTQLLTSSGASITYRSDDEETLLHVAARLGHEKVAEMLLSKGLDCNAVDKNLFTPLYLAALYGHMPIVRLLVKNKAHVDGDPRALLTPFYVAAMSGDKHKHIVEYLASCKSKMERALEGGKTLLHIAAYHGQKETCDALIKAGAYKNAPDVAKNTPLHVAIERGHLSIVKILLEQKANVLAKNEHAWTPLHTAAYKGNSEAFSLILPLYEEKGGKLDVLDSDGQSLLHVAVEGGHSGIIETLVKEKKMNIDLLDANGKTPLHRALWCAAEGSLGHIAVIEALIRLGADKNKRQKDGMTPLSIAIRKAHRHAVECLQREGADIMAHDGKGNSALHCAASCDRVDLLELLLPKGEDGGLDVSALERTNDEGAILLHSAAGAGAFDAVKYLLEKGGWSDKKDRNGNSLLHYACSGGNIEVVEAFLRELRDHDPEGTWLEAKDAYDYTPLHEAAKKGHADVVKLLLDKGATRNVVAKDKYPGYKQIPLHYAAREGRIDVVKLLLDDATKDARDELDRTPLHLAAMGGHIDVVKLFFEKGATRNVVDKGKKIPLHYAAREGRIDVVKLLLDDATKDARNEDDQTPLHLAAIGGHIDVVKLLLEKGATRNVVNKGKQIPLHYAAKRGHTEVVKLLLDDATKDARDEYDQTPFHLAAMGGHIDVVKLLLEKGATRNVVDKGKKIPLHYAAMEGHIEVVKLLLDDATKDARDEYDRTPLHLAAMGREYIGIVKLLLEKGATRNVVDKGKKIPLHYAAMEGHIEVVKLLLDDATKDARDEYDRTPLHLAAMGREYIGIVKLLLEKDATRNVVAKGGYPNYKQIPLHYASEKGYTKVVELLINDATKDARNEYDQTPLHLAAREGRIDVVKLLLEKKAKMDVIDKNGKKPLDLAIAKGLKNVVDLLRK